MTRQELFEALKPLLGIPEDMKVRKLSLTMEFNNEDPTVVVEYIPCERPRLPPVPEPRME